MTKIFPGAFRFNTNRGNFSYTFIISTKSKDVRANYSYFGITTVGWQRNHNNIKLNTYPFYLNNTVCRILGYVTFMIKDNINLILITITSFIPNWRSNIKPLRHTFLNQLTILNKTFNELNWKHLNVTFCWKLNLTDRWF